MTDHTKALTKAATRLEEAHTARDAAIIEARKAGLGPSEIATAVRLSRMQVTRILNAAKQSENDKEPPRLIP